MDILLIMLRFSTGNFDSYTNLHVEYIGQLFRNDGNRDALDRLLTKNIW